MFLILGALLELLLCPLVRGPVGPLAQEGGVDVVGGHRHHRHTGPRVPELVLKALILFLGVFLPTASFKGAQA
jgi:hypothetical protein